MKKMKKIMAAAIAMMTFSTAAAVTGTVAWFTASNVVTASGMSLQADTEQGINISNEAKEVWKESATASHTGIVGSGENAQQKFIPTTTEDGSAWKHGNSDDRNNSDAVGELETLTISGPTDGIAKVNKEGSSINGKNVYLLNKFYLRSSIPTAINASKLYVNSMVASGSAADAYLDLCFRVLVKCAGGYAFFAPFEETADTKAPVANLKSAKNVVLANNVTIPAASDLSTADAYEIEVYCYFEGNDSNCMSKNITATLNTLSLECKFGTEEIA